jgi:hypothetical protein
MASGDSTTRSMECLKRESASAFPPPLPGGGHDLIVCDRVTLPRIRAFDAVLVAKCHTGFTVEAAGRAASTGMRWTVSTYVVVGCRDPCADIHRSESLVGADTLRTRDRSPIARTNKIPIRDRIESSVRARNRRTDRHTPAPHRICSAWPPYEHSIVTEDHWAARLPIGFRSSALQYAINVVERWRSEDRRQK